MANLLILHVVGIRGWHPLRSSEGFGIISSQVFGHLRSFKGWIQTEACVIPSYHGMLIPWQKTEKQRDIISVANE